MERFEEIKQFFKGQQKRELPVFELSRQTIGPHWITLIPSDYHNHTVSIDLLLILKNLDYRLNDEQIESISELSILLEGFRRQLINNPLRCEIDSFYYYLMCIRKLSTMFENNHVAFSSYFTDCRYKECGHFFYEYINIVLLLVARIYHSYRDKTVDTETTKQMATCKILLEEVKQCCDLCTQDFTPVEKWVCIPPLLSITCNDDMKTSRASIAEKERDTLRQYISEDLCGSSTINERIMLFDAIKNEHRVTFMMGVAREKNVEESYRLNNDTIAPLTRNISMTYESITKLILSRGPSYLLNYTQFKAFYWYVYGELIMARADWSYYSLQNCSNWVDYAVKAKKRLDCVCEYLKSRAQWQRTIQLDETMSRHYTQLKTEITELYEKTEEDRISTRDAANPIEIKPFVFSQTDFTLNTILSIKWASFNEKHPRVVSTLKLLEHLSKQETSFVSTVRASPPMTRQVTQSLSNDMKKVILEERERHLNWLLSMHDPRNGSITLDNKIVALLEEEYSKLKNVIKENKNF
jgi:hypothetical protein